MKKLVILAILIGAVAISLSWLAKTLNRAEEAWLMGFAYGEPGNGTITMQVPVTILMVRQEGPKLRNGVIQWYEWIEEHLDLRDASGKKLDLQKLGGSNMISAADSAAPEFFVSVRLKPGEKYTFDYIPVLAEKMRYRHAFAAPAVATPFQRFSIDPLRTP